MAGRPHTAAAGPAGDRVSSGKTARGAVGAVSSPSRTTDATHLLHDAPFGNRRVQVRWRKRIWRCPEPTCPVVTFTETHQLAPPRALLTRRAVTWAADALSDDETTVNALARRLDVDWHTLWNALKVEARRRADDPQRLIGVESLGVDKHIWRPGRFGAGREVTCIVDLTRDGNGRVRARLLDLVLGRSGPAYARWLDARQPAFRVNIKRRARPVPRLRQRLVTVSPRRCKSWKPSTSSNSPPKSWPSPPRPAGTAAPPRA